MTPPNGSEERTLKPDRQLKTNQKNIFGLTGAELLARWKDGEEEAAAIIVERYSIRLVAMVASRMNRRFRVAVDPEDIVQSALGSFFMAARLSRLDVSRSVSVWNVLATFTKRKMLRSIERQSALKRGGDRQRVSIDDVLSEWIADPAADGNESIDELLSELEPPMPTDLRVVLDRLMQGDTRKQIAAELEIDERTVRRRWVRIREMLVPDPSPGQSRGDVGDDAIVESPSLPRIGYNKFVLGRMMGAGGFGKVYRAAMQSESSGVVAVKFLRKVFWQNRAARRSFVSEIDHASRIRHESVVRYVGWGESPQGGPYLISEWFDGVPLGHRRSDSAEVFLDRMVKILDAVRAVHDGGMVHGDLTPGNILVNEVGQVLVTDFGFSKIINSRIAGAQGESDFKTIPGGTPGFAAPEQISTAFGPLCPQTDFYAIGGLAYWYLTGRAPHERNTVELSMASTIDSINVDTESIQTKSKADEAIKRIAVAGLCKPIVERPSSIRAFMELGRRR